MFLVLSCLASFLIVSDIAMVNVALPSIVDALDFSSLNQLWFLNCYALLFCALPLLGGRLADVFGHRRIFLMGLCTFAVAGSICGFSSSTVVIETARGVQGIGGALLAATSLSLLTNAYPDGAQRRRVVAIWSATVAIGAVVGVLLGGVLTSGLSWRWVFFFGAIVAGGTAVLTLLGTKVQRFGDRARPLDVAGAALVTAGLALLTAGLIMSNAWGWSSGRVIALIVAGCGSLATFVRWESRCADPLMPVALFFSRRKIAAMVATAVVGFDLYFMYFAVSVFLQRAQRHGPLAAGVMTLPAALSVVAGSLGSPWMARLMQARTQLIMAMALVVAGFWWLSLLQVDARYWTNLAFPLMVIGCGFGTSFVPATLLLTGGMPSDRNGVAAGAVNTSRQLGRAVGLAALSGLVTAGLHPTVSPEVLAAGESHAFRICAWVTLAGLLVVIWLSTRGRATSPSRALSASVVR